MELEDVVNVVVTEKVDALATLPIPSSLLLNAFAQFHFTLVVVVALVTATAVVFATVELTADYYQPS